MMEMIGQPVGRDWATVGGTSSYLAPKNDVFEPSHLSRGPYYGQGAGSGEGLDLSAVLGSLGSVSKAILKDLESTPGYSDFSLALGGGIVLVLGAQKDEEGIHPYLGVGIGTPGISMTRSRATDSISPGLNAYWQFATHGATGAVGVSLDGPFVEYGIATPGVSAAAIWVFDPPNPKYPGGGWMPIRPAAGS